MQHISCQCGGDNLGDHPADPAGHGILLRWALQLVLEELDKEAETLIHAEGSPFCCPNKWTWESLTQFSLDSQQTFAMEEAPVLWSVLATITVSKQRRGSMELKDEGRDPWQVCVQSEPSLSFAESIGRELLLPSLSCSICGIKLLPSSPEPLVLSSSHATPIVLSTDSTLVLGSQWHTLQSTSSSTSLAILLSTP